ncbi:hypothetical protein POL68_41380 [Stigmatella sp. ncwal1]|uniref:Uncharacterized protein n=1 Tax=Stigmatella ashevillensis TaxID=2995309 RepID=A0ABT5DMU4_9BACT|nr:hypothetical protein [Stigmatella ashevillena]MDC0714974.1 hypothetical protein [Stigmatella ashevillena]
MGGVETGHLRRQGGRRQNRLTTSGRWFSKACLLAATLAAAADAPDRIAVDRRGGVLELAWSDTEERLQGALQPMAPRAGEPLKVTLHVGSFQGTPFEGPITLSLRERGSTHGQVQTVQKGAVNWHAEFVPERAALHQLDVSFRTTRLKVLHAEFEVGAHAMPSFILWGLLGLGGIIAMVMGVRMLQKEKPTEPPAAETEISSAPKQDEPSRL